MKTLLLLLGVCAIGFAQTGAVLHRQLRAPTALPHSFVTSTSPSSSRRFARSRIKSIPSSSPRSPTSVTEESFKALKKIRRLPRQPATSWGSRTARLTQATRRTRRTRRQRAFKFLQNQKPGRGKEEANKRAATRQFEKLGDPGFEEELEKILDDHRDRQCRVIAVQPLLDEIAWPIRDDAEGALRGNPRLRSTSRPLRRRRRSRRALEKFSRSRPLKRFLDQALLEDEGHRTGPGSWSRSKLLNALEGPRRSRRS